MDDLERQVGDYRLIKKLGEGAAGEVYLATPVRDKQFATVGSPLAIKLYKPAVLKERNQLERITREFKVGSGIAHPNLVRIFDVVTEGKDAPYLVMEFIDGVPLSTWIEQFHPVAGGLLLTLVEQLVSALGKLHEQDVIHRDLKPANVMVSSSFTVSIMDFGVVHISSESPITDKDKFVGTIRNASPELLRGRPFDHRTDLYSLGTILYALLYGEDVFADENQFVRLADQVESLLPEFNEPAVSRDQVCNGLLTLTKRLLSKRPEDRLQTAGDIQTELQTLRGILSKAPAPDPMHGYVATALTNLDADGRAHITFASSKIAEVAKQHGFYVYQPRRATDPLLHKDVDPETVYSLDRKKVVGADLLVVLLNKPSFGVGQELEIAAGYGKPTLLIREEGVHVSRMVLGSTANIVGDIIYTTPEDLERKLHRILGDVRAKVGTWRKGAGRGQDAVSLGPRVKELRIQRGFTTPEKLADTLGIAGRLIRAVENGNNENVGVLVLTRIAEALNVDTADLLQPSASAAKANSTDIRLVHLERVARRDSWSADDYIALREEYSLEQAASGSSEIVPEEEWLRRKRALDRRKADQSPVTDLFRQDAGGS